MNLKTITILLAGLMGFILTAGGTYILIDNLINPQGYLFEGVVLTSLGMILDITVIIAASLGKTIMMFADIMNKQADIQEEIMKQSNKQASGGMGGFLENLMKGGQGSVIIKDLSDPDADPKSMPLGDGMQHISEIMSNLGKGKKSLGDMDVDELEKELAKAVKKDDFEKADEIKKEIQSRQGNSGEEKKSE